MAVRGAPCSRLHTQMANTHHSLPYDTGTITYEVCTSSRTTLGITVYPDRRVLVRAPRTMPSADVHVFVRKRARWIANKTAHFAQLQSDLPYDYREGERHFYLGQRYPLRIMHADTESVSLAHGCLWIECRDSCGAHIRELLNEWYAAQAARYFAIIVDECWAQFSARDTYPQPVYRIKSMRTRWGSMSRHGRMSLNVSLMKADRACVAYVIVHEFCHLVHFNHGAGFYALLAQNMPEWARYKGMLARIPI